MIYLYVKTHKTTGLKYLGKTTAKDPHKYRGSSKYWRSHLNVHGTNYTTTILLATEDKQAIKETGLFFSKLWNVVKSKEWANFQEEKGDGVSSTQATAENLRRVANGTHHYLGAAHNHRTKARRSATIRANGTHNFLGGSIQRAAYQRRVNTGEQEILNRQSAERLIQRTLSGRHPMQQGKVLCVDSDGQTIYVDKQIYRAQCRLVHVNTLEGRRRRKHKPS